MAVRTEKILDIIAFIILIATIFCLRIRERNLENIIRGKAFVLEFVIAGVLVSSTFLILLYKLMPKYFEGEGKRASAILSFFFGLIAFTLFGASQYNIETAQENTRVVTAVVVKKSLNLTYKTPYLTTVIDGRKERFSPNRTEWDKINEADTLRLTVGKGKLGYDFIFKFLTE